MKCWTLKCALQTLAVWAGSIFRRSFRTHSFQRFFSFLCGKAWKECPRPYRCEHPGTIHCTLLGLAGDDSASSCSSQSISLASPSIEAPKCGSENVLKINEYWSKTLFFSQVVKVHYILHWFSRLCNVFFLIFIQKLFVEKVLQIFTYQNRNFSGKISATLTAKNNQLNVEKG